MSSENKIININDIKNNSAKTVSKTKSLVNTGNAKKKRIVTGTKQWTATNQCVNVDKTVTDISIINSILSKTTGVTGGLAENAVFDKNELLVIQQINRKLYSYKTQDLEKNKYNVQEIIDLTAVLRKLVECNMKCFYCLEKVELLYEFVREPKQWTVERIDNTLGHNTTNSEIACLQCNLRRRTMFHERYIFTKQVAIVKSDT